MVPDRFSMPASKSLSMLAIARPGATAANVAGETSAVFGGVVWLPPNDRVVTPVTPPGAGAASGSEESSPTDVGDIANVAVNPVLGGVLVIATSPRRVELSA